jgi:hypothetical protein
VASSEPITFLCAAARSGTTLLRIMLNGNPALKKVWEMDWLFDYDDPADPRDYIRRITLDRVFQGAGLAIKPGLTTTELVRDLVAQTLEPGKVTVINVHRRFENILDVYPDARFIHLIRDPRDVARSVVAMGWAGNAYYGVEHWICAERSFGAVEGRLGGGAHERVHTLHFRDLILDAERALAAICVFLGVPYTDNMLRNLESSTYAAPDPRLVDQWKTKASPEEVALVEARAADLMRARGYALPAEAPAPPGRLKRWRLALDHKIGRLRFAVQRYGVILPSLEVLGRRLQLRPLEERARRKIDMIDARYLK